MIGKLKGRLSEVQGNIGLLETESGIYYEVFLTPSIINKKRVDRKIEIYTYLQVREDALILFGFQTKEEHNFFKMLLSVSGVGPKTAYSVISFSKVADLVTAIKENNTQYFTRIPGLGRKTSMKIILELSQKLESEFEMEKMYLSDDDKTVIEALVSLGFKSFDAKRIFNKIPKDLNLEEKIKVGLKIGTNTK